MEQWTPATAQTISKHCADFNLSNYAQKIAGFGGYDRYLTEFLGGVFADGPVSPVRTVAQFRRRIEYVQGLMAIWGFDYSNGNDPATRHYYRWGQGSGTKPAPDAFYQSGYGKCNTGTISQLCQGLGSRGRTTCCNYGIDTVLKACGLFRTNTDKVKTWATKYGKVVTKKEDLRPGDIVHFYKKPVDRGNPNKWGAGEWCHVAIVHTVEGSKIWLADFGSRFIKSKKPLHYMMKDGSALAGGEYSRYWTAIHAFDFEEEQVKSDTDKAVEMKRDLMNYFEAKEKEYGPEVSQIMTHFLGDKDDYLRAAADYVLNGYAGSGEARKAFLGSEYESVQQKVNDIIQKAEDVITGKYGTGDVRKAALGDDYEVVQRQVNRILKG